MTWVKNATPEQEAASHFPAIIAVCILFTVLMLMIVSLRLAFRKGILGLDDYLIVYSSAMSVVFTTFAIVETRWGLGLPLDLRPPTDGVTFRKISYAGKPWYMLVIGGYKAALCVSYLRLLAGTDKRNYRRVIMTVGIASFVLHIVFPIINLLICMPVTKNFYPTSPGHCIPFLPLNYTMSGISIMLDIIIFLLPIPIFRSLNMDRRTKLTICGLFACGFVTTICSIIRAVFLRQASSNGNGDNTVVVVMCSVEGNVGIAMSCLPFLRTMLKRLRRGGGHSGYSRENHARPSYTLDSYSGTSYAAAANSQASKKPFNKKLERSDSEEIILEEDSVKSVPVGADFPAGAIVKTTHFTVR